MLIGLTRICETFQLQERPGCQNSKSSYKTLYQGHSFRIKIIFEVRINEAGTICLYFPYLRE